MTALSFTSRVVRTTVYTCSKLSAGLNDATQYGRPSAPVYTPGVVGPTWNTRLGSSRHRAAPS
jgi:hypothetical protein